MSRFPCMVLFALLVGSSCATCVEAQSMVRRPIEEKALPHGFHISAAPQPARPAQFRALHPRPTPLTSTQISGLVAKFGIHGTPIHMPVQPDITYQLEVFDQNTGAEVNTTSLQNTVFYTAGPNGMGYIQVTFNVNPGVQNLLDCSLGMDGTFRVISSITGSPNAEGTISSFNQHLMIPFSVTPANAKTAQATIYFDSIEFDGCTLLTVSQ